MKGLAVRRAGPPVAIGAILIGVWVTVQADPEVPGLQVFEENTVLTADALNDNFAALQAEIQAVHALAAAPPVIAFSDTVCGHDPNPPFRQCVWGQDEFTPAAAAVYKAPDNNGLVLQVIIEAAGDRPIELSLFTTGESGLGPLDSASFAACVNPNSSDGAPTCSLRFRRDDGDVLGVLDMQLAVNQVLSADGLGGQANAGLWLPPSAFRIFDFEPNPGFNTYTLEVYPGALVGQLLLLHNTALMAREL